jgi:hypothetical protein
VSNILQSIRTIITNAKVVLKAHAWFPVAETSRVPRGIIPEGVPVLTLMQLSITSHTVAVAVQRSAVRVAHDVLAQGVEAVKGMVHGELRRCIAGQGKVRSAYDALS